MVIVLTFHDSYAYRQCSILSLSMAIAIHKQTHFVTSSMRKEGRQVQQSIVLSLLLKVENREDNTRSVLHTSGWSLKGTGDNIARMRAGECQTVTSHFRFCCQSCQSALKLIEGDVSLANFIVNLFFNHCMLSLQFLTFHCSFFDGFLKFYNPFLCNLLFIV